MDTRVGTSAVIWGMIWLERVMRRLWIVFNDELEGSACILDHTLYLEEIKKLWSFGKRRFIKHR